MTIDRTYESETVIRGSRFIGVLMPCDDEDDIGTNLATVSSRYPNATHYCYAAIHHGPERRERFSDNGEPSGTAGRPILLALGGSGLSNVMCIVVRYFGGTLLGTGGLVHAYTESSRACCSMAEPVSMRACSVFDMRLDYRQNSVFENRMRGFMAIRPETRYTECVDVRAWVPVDMADDFLRRLSDIIGHDVPVTIVGTEHVRVP